MVEAAETIQNALYPERREKTIKYMIRHLDHYLDYQQGYRAGCCAGLRRYLSRGLFCFRVGNRYGNYLVMLYTATKMMYVANVALQLLLLDLLLGAGYHLYGAHVIADALSGKATATRTPIDFDPTAIRPPFYSHSIAVWPRYDRSTTYVTTELLHCGPNI